MNKKFHPFFMLFADSKSTLKFLIGVVAGLAFSIAVILATMGIMDGFVKSLNQGLKNSMGDATMISRNGFFVLDSTLQKNLKFSGVAKFSGIVQTESFLIVDEDSHGVMVNGVGSSYGGVVGIPLHELKANEVAVGFEIAKLHHLKVGDEIVLAFGRGNQEMKSLPTLVRLTISQIIHHGIYQKDSRLVYMRLDEIQRLLEFKNRINLVAMNIGDKHKIEESLLKLRELLGHSFSFKPYWKEFASLLEAVRIEKVMISLILQLVVVISVFNILAMIIFINEKKSKELFLFKALGVSQKKMGHLWLELVLVMWAAACILSVIFIEFFKLLLAKLWLFELPAEIYFMPRLELFLNWKDYGFVFLLALFWIFVITYLLLRKLMKKSLLEGLRQEFA
jgi:ABC-type lipoprotein release transport system permease subunit